MPGDQHAPRRFTYRRIDRGGFGEGSRPSIRRSTARFSALPSIGQSAISSSVRLQPRQRPVAGSIRQTLVQGEAGGEIEFTVFTLEQEWVRAKARRRKGAVTGRRPFIPPPFALGAAEQDEGGFAA
jgi:hypothetical protein